MPKGILNKASLVMVPEAPIDGTMPSVFPEDRSGDFTFTRGSNLAATRVASNGLIEKGRENEALYSNTFSSWNAASGGSVTSGQSGYDGSSDAWLLSKTSDWGRIERTISYIGVYTISVYAKAASTSWLAFENAGITSDTCYFDLQNGATGVLGSSTISATITSVGNGWYRCTQTLNGTSSTQRIYGAHNDGNINGSNTSIYIQDFQLEAGLVATSYIESGATTGKAGLLENEPRIDFTGGGCGSLLLEPQRTNYILNSNFLASSWPQTNASVSINTAISPDGYQNAHTATRTSGNNYRVGTASFLAVVGQPYTNSIYLRSVSGSGVVNLVDINNSPTTINLTSEWARYSVTTTATAVTQRLYVDMGADGDVIEFYGAQVEQGSYPTSYIPTYGNIVTRSAEICSLSSASSIIGQTEGVIYAEVELTEGYDSNQIFFNLSDATFANQMFFQRYNGSLGYKILSGGTTQAENYPITSGTTHKVALLYSEDNIKMFANGSRVSLDTSASIPATNKINLSSYWNGLLQFGGGIKKAVLFPTALTDEECSALTQP